jgi:predicted nucleic acid-binding protein
MNSFFLDSNQLVYLATENSAKAIKVKALLNKTDTAFISTQVLNEFTSVCFKKQLLEPEQIEKYVLEYKLRFEVSDIDFKTVAACFAIKNKYKYSWYDSLIITRALLCNCTTLYTEDMQHNQVIENRLTICNPFF